MSLKGKKVYTRKCKGSLYKWAPQGEKKKFKKDSGPNVNSTINGGNFCVAMPYTSSGEDRITKYVVKRIIINGQVTYEAYVACDYVK